MYTEKMMNTHTHTHKALPNLIMIAAVIAYVFFISALWFRLMNMFFFKTQENIICSLGRRNWNLQRKRGERNGI